MKPDISILKIEAQFAIASFEAQADQMSREQAIEMLKFCHRHMQLQKHSYNELLLRYMLPEVGNK